MWERSRPPAVYLNAAQFPNGGATYTILAKGDPLALAPAAMKALALGARREDVFRLILRRAGWLTGSGLVVGILMALGLARMVANLLYRVRPDDPAVFITITVTSAAIAILASSLPARRAARIDPSVALRDE